MVLTSVTAVSLSALGVVLNKVRRIQVSADSSSSGACAGVTGATGDGSTAAMDATSSTGSGTPDAGAVSGVAVGVFDL
ncbi:hypothetical protein [Mycolicibacterium pulveris]|uniref:hypothetical protein n=1 Tax=Mycolicibacterium pulveris TaxID=36813 RepID=UPI003CEE4CB3